MNWQQAEDGVEVVVDPRDEDHYGPGPHVTDDYAGGTLHRNNVQKTCMGDSSQIVNFTHFLRDGCAHFSLNSKANH